MARNYPIYKTVKDALRQKIESRELPPDQRIPSEEQLASEFGCSRLTTHRALRELAEEGYLIRRRRAGTRVAQRAGSGVLIRVPDIRNEIRDRGQSYRYERLSRRLAVPALAVAKRLAAEPGRRMLKVTCRHWAGSRVFQYESRWINLDVVPGALSQEFRDASANRWLLETVPYSRVDHEIRAVAADKSCAGRLRVKLGSPVLQIERLTQWDGKGVTSAVLLHPGPLLKLRSGVK